MTETTDVAEAPREPLPVPGMAGEIFSFMPPAELYKIYRVLEEAWSAIFNHTSIMPSAIMLRPEDAGIITQIAHLPVIHGHRTALVYYIEHEDD